MRKERYWTRRVMDSLGGGRPVSIPTAPYLIHGQRLSSLALQAINLISTSLRVIGIEQG